MALVIPSNLQASIDGQGWHDWVLSLPKAIAQAAALWDLTVGAPFEPGGQTSWVAPVIRGTEDLVLKVLWRHPEAEQEAAALTAWDGRGAIRLIDVIHLDDTTTVLLLERCAPGSTLRELPEPEQDLVMAEGLPRLWITPLEGIPHLQAMCENWADEAAALPVPEGLDPGIVRAGLDLFRSLAAPSSDDVLLATDLHAGNVLRAEREPWLAIDPKPHVGDRAYDLTQHVLNCERLVTAPHELIKRLADLSGLDPEHLLRWTFARCCQEAPGWTGPATAVGLLARAALR